MFLDDGLFFFSRENIGARRAEMLRADPEEFRNLNRRDVFGADRTVAVITQNTSLNGRPLTGQLIRMEELFSALPTNIAS
jgi:hypothetical protein